MILWLYILGITIAEITTALLNPQWGIVMHGFLLVGLLISSFISREEASYKIYLSMTPAPLIRMISLGLPLTNFPQIYWYVLTGTAMFLATSSVLRVLGYRLKDVGLHFHSFGLQFLIGLLGFGLGVVEYFILRPQPLIKNLTLANLWLPSLYLIFFTGLVEEYTFRGVMQKAVIDTIGISGIFPISVLFAVLHVGHLSFLDVLFVFAVALIFSVIAKKSKTIIGISLAHGITNVMLYLVCPFWFQ